MTILLASASLVRLQLLRTAGLDVEAQPARIDEAAMRASLAAENATPRDVADILAEAKAQKVSRTAPGRLVLGCDQVLALDGMTHGKPGSAEEAAAHLAMLAGRQHSLLSVCVAYEDGAPIWRHVGVVRMTMRALSPGFIDAYVGRNWPDIAGSVGGYRIEDEGVRLFTRIDGSHYDVLGLPLLPLLSWLALRGDLPT